MSGNAKIDITHKTRRYQQDIETEGDFKEESGEINERTIPINVTLESAISFYEKYAEGECEVLYRRTANWLKMLFNNVATKQFMTGIPDAVRQFVEERNDAKEELNDNEKE